MDKMTTVTISKNLRKKIGQFLTGNETMDEGLERIIEEYESMKK